VSIATQLNSTDLLCADWLYAATGSVALPIVGDSWVASVRVYIATQLNSIQLDVELSCVGEVSIATRVVSLWTGLKGGQLTVTYTLVHNTVYEIMSYETVYERQEAGTHSITRTVLQVPKQDTNVSWAPAPSSGGLCRWTFVLEIFHKLYLSNGRTFCGPTGKCNWPQSTKTPSELSAWDNWHM